MKTEVQKITGKMYVRISVIKMFEMVIIKCMDTRIKSNKTSSVHVLKFRNVCNTSN